MKFTMEQALATYNMMTPCYEISRCGWIYIAEIHRRLSETSTEDIQHDVSISVRRRTVTCVSVSEINAVKLQRNFLQIRPGNCSYTPQKFEHEWVQQWRFRKTFIRLGL
jgi:hypothetical protein